MKKINKNIPLLLLALIFTLAGQSQTMTKKLKERFNTTDKVAINLDTQYADVIFEDWNKNEVEIEAILETDGLSQAEIKDLMANWNISVQGNSTMIRIQSSGGPLGFNIALGDVQMRGLDDLIASSMQMVQPMMQNMIGPFLENFQGKPLPPEFHQGMKNLKFDFEAYKKEGDKYLENYKKKMEASFGKDFDKVMEQWASENAQKMKGREGMNNKGVLGMPASPFGKNRSFDGGAYDKNKKGYLAEMNKKYGTSVTQQEVDKWRKDMEAWGEDFGKGMEAWGARFGKQFDGEMKAWGENLGKVMESWGETVGKQMEQMAKSQGGNFQKSVFEDANGNVSSQMSYSYSAGSKPKAGTGSSVKRKIIVRMPKESKLDLNVRHGNIQIGETLNARVNLSHGSFTAKSVGGSKTLVSVAYSPVDVNNWDYGTLQTSYSKSCVIAKAKSITIDSRASNVIINELEDSAMIRGSFGELSIPRIGKNFKILNVSLENSDLVLRLPETAFHFTYNGVRSNLDYPKKLEVKSMKGFDSNMVNGFYKSRDTESTITISSKFSDVVLN